MPGAPDKDKYGGGAESYARFKQYDYRANSSLVLTSDNRTRDLHEPSGEPESLWGKMKGKMGDRVQYAKPEGYDGKKEKKRKRDSDRDIETAAAMKSRKAGGGSTVLDLDNAGFYRPRTKETRDAYELMLSIIHTQFGDQPADVLRGAADEVLAVLKDKSLKDPDRQKECQQLMGLCDDEMFSQLVRLGKMINDYSAEGEEPQPADTLDEEIGVAVEFEDEEEEEDSEVSEVARSDDEEDDDEGGEEGEGGPEGEAGRGDASAPGDIHTATMDVDDGEEATDDGLKVQEIDAYWLQRRIAKAFGDTLDADTSQKLAEKVLAALELPEEREVENSLVVLLDYEKFDLIKQLVRNRLRIVWCMRLGRAQDEEERRRVEVEMSARTDTAAILDALRATRTSARERQSAVERSIREEARRLRQGGAAGARGAEAVAAAAGRRVVDMEALTFNAGSHLMSNKSCTLPSGSYRATPKKGYEEVHVPALKPKPFASGERLRPIEELPEWARSAFAGMKTLNRVQSRVCDSALFSAENLLVCAPTGAGKTNVAMLAILHELGLHRNEDEGTFDTSKFKVVYVAPMKALVAEMVGNFSTRLKPYGVNVRELTGDINLSKAEIEDTQVIVTTPEKWDIITRKSDDRAYTAMVRLLIIDEIHLLHDTRGPVIECIVARTLRQVEARMEVTRILGLSATLPNYEDVATLLRVNPDKGLFYFDNSFRPCPLAQQYIGITVKKPLQRFALMNEITYTKVMDSAGKHQVLIFVHSRKETAKTARYLKDTALANDMLSKIMRDDSASREILSTEADSVKDADLRDLLPYGFAVHHAGMARADRTLVEDLFADGHVQILVSTATLAWGVNLPAHTVIIKGTQVYNPVKGGWDELSPQDVMQMMGRAGRPQYDSFGEGIIITGHAELQFYLSLFNQQLPIESQFARAMADNLNAEVVLGTVATLQDAAAWLGYTYLYVRMLRAPALYGVPLAAVDGDPLLLERRLDLAHTAATLLDKHNLIRYDRKTGNLQSTELGRIASHYYVTYNTIAAFNEHLKPTMGDIELLRLFSLADEFKYMVVREEEKVEMAKLIERVPVPVKESLDEPTAKINVLLQAYISNLKLDGLALASDMVYVTQSAGRLMRCLFELCMRRGWAALTDKALALCKMVAHRMWGSQTPLRQMRGIPADILSRVEKKDLPWERYYDLTSAELGEMLRLPKMGKTLHRLVHSFPRLELAARVQPVTRTMLKLDLTLTPDFQWDDKVHGHVEPFWILVEDQDSENILYHQYWLLRKALATQDHSLSFTVPISEPLPPQYFVRVVSDRWLQCESLLPVSFRHLILPERFPPPTELLDLQPLPVTALRNSEYEALYSGQLATFNPIQTQVFSALYNSDDNVLLAAPTGSGKTLCAEFAVLRTLSRAKEGKCAARVVYVAPNEPLAAERLADWGAKFGAKLGLNVVALTGETSSDLQLLERGNIIVSTPERWDMLSRRWKQRKNVQAVALFLVDELHLIGGASGHVLEVVVSRMRYISAQLSSPIRIVALSHSVANARDLGEWLGASSHGLFHFAPGVRPVPLEVHVQGLDMASLDARMAAMARPTYSAIAQHGGQKPVMVFVPTRKHARLTAMDLLVHAAADGQPQKFLMMSEADLEPYLARVREASLRHSLRYGVAFIHQTTSSSDREVVDLLYGSGAVQVLVATAPCVWGLTLSCHLVVIMGTQYFDSSGLGSADYPVTDLIHMLGRACRPQRDDSGRALLLCHAPRKEYYKKFLFEPLPVESHLDHFLADHFVAEVVTRTIENKQDAVDYLTWTFYYRRLAQNPNYYGLTGSSHRHLSDHLSELVESTLSDLATARAVAVEDEMDLSPLNLGMISAYYYITYTTVELFASSLTAKTKLRGLVEVLAAASEFDELPVRPGEEEEVRHMLAHAPLSVDKPQYGDPHTKANALLQAHLSRKALKSGDLQLDQRTVVAQATRLLQAMVDVIASSDWLSPALAAMELSQMVSQALWEKDSPLMQLPHFTPELCHKCDDKGVASVFDLLDMPVDARRDLLALSERQLDDVAAACARYPDIQLAFDMPGGRSAHVGEQVSVVVTLERELAGELGPVHAPRYPGRKDESWWLVLGDAKANRLLAIKRVTLARTARVKLDFAAPPAAGRAALTLFFMCDSYLGADQEYEVELEVLPGGGGEDSE